MTNDAQTPLRSYFSCPLCGQDLLVESDGFTVRPDDSVFCPVHGTIGPRSLIRARGADATGAALAALQSK